jgi:hypothetical protein
MSQSPGPEQEGQVRSIQASERRAWVRYPRRLQSLWQVFGARAEEPWTADVQDISQTGIGLILQRAFPAASVLTVRLRTAAQKLSRTMLVRVRHCTALPDGQWLVGCTFVVQLTDEELRELLTARPAVALQAAR